MDIIKFNNWFNPLIMDQGEIVNGIKNKLWIERYDEAGEFTFKAPVSSNIREKLPIGSFVSHINTQEIMIVENHEISENQDSESEIIVTGRGFETIFENRIVGSNSIFPNMAPFTDYTLAAAYTWGQIVTLINDHILPANLEDDNDAIPYITIFPTITETSVVEERALQKGTLYAHVLNLLSINYYGIKVMRPGPWSPLTGLGSPDTVILIHEGEDRSQDVIFSHDAGEIISADYLWSNKNLKNACLVTGTWVEIMVFSPVEVEYNRRVMYIDAKEVDSMYEEAPSGATLDLVIAHLQRKGTEALLAQKTTAIAKAELSKEGIKAKYRVDFDVGDLVTVIGDYNETSKMRVTEYVEIEDENGENGYPTLSME